MQPKKSDPNCRTEIIDLISDQAFIVIHTSDDDCTTMMIPQYTIEMYMEPGDKIKCICGRLS